MAEVERMIKDCLDSWTRSKTLGYAQFHDLMYQVVSILQDGGDDTFEDLLRNAVYSSPGTFHYLVEINEIKKALSSQSELLSSSISLSSVYLNVWLNFLEGPLKHALLCVLYGLRKKADPSLKFRAFYNRHRYLTDIVKNLQVELNKTSKNSVLSSALTQLLEIDAQFIRNKIAHHEYHIVTGVRNDKSIEVKGIFFIDGLDVNSIRNVYIGLGQLRRYLQATEGLIITLGSSVDIFVKMSIKKRGLCIEDICKKCPNCGTWMVSLTSEFLAKCEMCSAIPKHWAEN